MKYTNVTIFLFFFSMLLTLINSALIAVYFVKLKSLILKVPKFVFLSP